MNIYEKLSEIQNELKVPKGQRNTFGNYNFRSCEDIMETAKPVCKKHKTTLVVGDTLVQLGDRYYIEAKATLYDLESDTSIINTAYAREEETKKGMDASQITGATSSYARKYALNGLFNIDDNKDADTNEYTKRTKEVSITEDTIKLMEELNLKSVKAGVDLDTICETYKVKSTAQLTLEQLKNAINKLNKNIKENGSKVDMNKIDELIGENQNE